MAIEVHVPQMGESINEATVIGWRFEVGQLVRNGETLVDLETDKVTVEVPAPEDALLKKVHCQTGEVVKVGQLLATMEEAQIEDGSPAAAAIVTESAPRELQRGGVEGGEIEKSGIESRIERSGIKESFASNDVLPPAAARLAAEEGINVGEVKGSGIRGQVTKADLALFLEKRGLKEAAKPGGAVAAQTAPKQSRADLSAKFPTAENTLAENAFRPLHQAAEAERIVPISSLRRRIAERLVHAQHTAAILTTFNEIDMQRAMELRSRYKELFQKNYGIGLGYMSIFSKAVIHAIQAVPVANAEIREQNIVYRNYCNIGVAVGGPRGLVVPVVKGAERMSFAQIEQEISRLAQKVKESSITLEELEGGTFTISNGGIYGSMLSTPILNPPQSGILGMHNIVKRPVVINDQITIRPIMYVAFSYDHRLIDGKDAVTFLVKVKEAVENPERMLLAI